MKSSLKFVSLFVLAALVLAACTSPAAPTEAPAMPASTTEVPMATETTIIMPTESPTMETQAPSPESTADDSSEGMEVEIEDFAYVANALTVKVGTTVTWTNKDTARHTVSSDTGVFESGLFGKGESFSYTFTEVGVFPYYCAPHPYMMGTITVIQ